MESTHFAPLPLGSDAFMPPLAPVSEPPEPSKQRWVVVGVAGLGVVVFGTVMALTLLVRREPEPIAPEPRAAATPATTPAATPAATEVRPGATIAAAALPVAGPALEAPPPAAPPAPVHAAAPASKPSATERDDDGEHDRGRTRSRRSSRGKEPQLDKPTRAQVLAAMSRVQRQVKACMPGGRGSITADVKVLGKTGRVTTAQISGQKGEVGSCVARAVRKAKFPKFSTESISIRYPMAF